MNEKDPLEPYKALPIMQVLKEIDSNKSKSRWRAEIKAGAIECIWPHFRETVKDETYVIMEYDLPVLLRYGKHWTEIK